MKTRKAKVLRISTTTQAGVFTATYRSKTNDYSMYVSGKDELDALLKAEALLRIRGFEV